nr:MAG TPA: hypothetical protein [Caudoviricetes sp.]
MKIHEQIYISSLIRLLVLHMGNKKNLYLFRYALEVIVQALLVMDEVLMEQMMSYQTVCDLQLE